VPRTHRLVELDAVRTALVFAVVVFHGLRVFDPFDFYVKGPEVDALAPVILLGGLVGMPLFFVLAGASLWHSMGRRAPMALARERVRRLGVPFVVAVVVLVPPQIHAQRMQAGTAGTYWDTLRDFFDVRLAAHFPIPVDGAGGGPFEPAHVWFLAYLLAFTLVLLPVLWPLRRDATRGAALARRLGSGRGLLLAMLAVAAVEGAHASEDAGGWSRWAYPIFLVLGFLLAADPSAAAVVARLRRPLALAAATAFVALAATGAALHDRLGDGLLTGHAPAAVGWRAGQGIAGCLLVAVVVGALAARPARVRPPGGGRVLAWARTVALPVYIVHQTVGVLCAYAVLRAGVPVAVAAVAIIVTTTAVSVLLAEALRRTPLRAAFGMGRTRGTGPSGAPRTIEAGVAPTPAG
jgi:glucans biosynthesis protein C